MEEDDFYLKWEKHHNAFVSVFDSLYKHNILVDCILAAEERYIKAHRIVLMACSPYMEELLSQHCDNYPIVFLDIKFSELQAIVDFCYRGEVKLPQHELTGFIKAANTLRIKGLCSSEMNGGGGPKGRKRETGGGGGEAKRVAKRQRSSGAGGDKMENESQVSESAKVPDVAVLEGDGAPVTGGDVDCVLGDKSPDIFTHVLDNSMDLSQLDQGSDNSDVDTESSEDGEMDVSDLLQQGSAAAYLFPWTCNRCGEAFTTRNIYTEHRRACMDTTHHPWACHKCTNSYKNKKDLVRHLIYCGNEVARLVCDRCSSTYKYERGLRRHQKYCGTDTKPLQCARCDKTYKYKRGLRRHELRCGVQKPRHGGLVIIKTETAKDQPAVAADNGPDGFASALGHEPWACNCGKAYKYRRSYLKHADSCSGIPKKQPPPSADCNEAESASADVEIKSEAPDAEEEEDRRPEEAQ